jgi:hypothetical protein
MVIDGGNGPSRKGGKAPARRGPRMEEPHTLIRLPEDPYAGTVPRRSSGRGRGLLALAVLTVVVAAAITLSNGTHKKSDQSAIAGVGGGVPGQTPSVTATTSAASAVSQGTNPQAGAPTQFSDSRFPGLALYGAMTGYPDTKEGAEAAAANYVSAYESQAMLTPSSRHKLIHSIADPAIESSLQAQLDQAYTTVCTGLGLDKNCTPSQSQTAVARTFALGVNTQSYSKGKATVAVWNDNIIGTVGDTSSQPIAENWTTTTVVLTWVNGDWKWTSFTATDGPTPVSNQQASSSADIQKAVQQFSGLRYAP